MKIIRCSSISFYFFIHSFTNAQFEETFDYELLPEPINNPTLSAVKEQLFEHGQKIQKVRNSLFELEKKLKFNSTTQNSLPVNDQFSKEMSEPLAYPIDSGIIQKNEVDERSEVYDPKIVEKEIMGVSELIPKKQRIGFYILPFIALQSSDGLDYMHTALQSSMEHEIGFASGWRIGAETNRLFIEGEFSYNRNELKGTAKLANGVPGFSSLSSIGESESFGFMINAGSKFSLNPNTELVFGAGFGGMNQEIGFSLAGFPVPESEKTIFTGQFLGGINYQLAENFRLGARYRWMRVGKMDLFSYRSLHLAELSLGYVF
jgi:opacity protein-like surface antigen